MIEYHADDYGLFYEQSKRIVDCIQNGVINGVSIMPNSEYLDDCMELLKGCNVELTIHLNLVEGKCLCKDNHLIIKKERFDVTFGRLLLISYIPFLRKKYKFEIKRELKAQISHVSKFYANKPVRLDSHCHFHMIPVVFDALMEIIKEENLSVSYIRLPKENIGFYLSKGKKDKILLINIVKVIVLDILCLRNKRHFGNYLNTLHNMRFAGVMYSGSMNYNNVKYILEHIKNSSDYEILFHPGAVYEDENIAQLTSKDDIIFLTSNKRKEEAEATRLLKKERR